MIHYTNRVCPFHDCTRKISPDFFCCPRHWIELNSVERAAIYACFDSWQAELSNLEELRNAQQAVLGSRGNARKNDALPGTPAEGGTP